MNAPGTKKISGGKLDLSLKVRGLAELLKYFTISDEIAYKNWK